MEFKLDNPLHDVGKHQFKNIDSNTLDGKKNRDLEVHRIFTKNYEGFEKSKNNEVFLTMNKKALVNRIEPGNYNNLDRYSDYIDDGSHMKTNSKSILIKRLDKGMETNVKFDLDNKNYTNNNTLVKDSLGDLEIPLTIPIKDMNGDITKKNEPTLKSYKNSDYVKINTPYHRGINTDISKTYNAFGKTSSNKKVYLVNQ